MLWEYSVILKSWAEMILSEVNENHDIVDTGNAMCWELELNTSHGVIYVETNWPKEK